MLGRFVRYACRSQFCFLLVIGAWIAPLLCMASPDRAPCENTWPSLTPVGLQDIELAVRENLFDRTHFVIESSCRVTPFARPLDFLESQVTAQWSQSILLQIEPTHSLDFSLDIGAGYGLERYTHAAQYGEVLTHSIEPAVLFPITLFYNRPNRYGYAQSFFKLEWEVNSFSFSRSTTIFHRLLAHSQAKNVSAFTIYGKERISSYSPLDTDFESKYYQMGFMLEHQSY